MDEDDDVDIVFKWNGDDYTVTMAADECVTDLKRRLGELTLVLPKRQKLMGLKTGAGKPATDACLVGELKLKSGQKVMMLGAPEALISATNDSNADGGIEIADDFQMQEDLFEQLEPSQDPDVLDKLERRIKKVEVKVLNAPREGKKLLVVDIDYTIFDLGSSAETPMELARPHLHAFFQAAYADFDIVIWSANSMKWMLVKMNALGVLTHSGYKVSFMLDCRSMLTVMTQKHGVFDCKPLPLLWRKFPQFGPHNTIMLDDLRRNYILNKQSGLVIRPFRKAHQRRATDRELVRLKYYLREIAKLDDFLELDHSKWERWLQKRLSPEALAQLSADVGNP